MIKKMEGFSKEGNWYKGNLHCHTTDSDGSLTPAEVVQYYKKEGYDFLAISDHNIFSDYRRDFDCDEFIILPAVEASAVLYKDDSKNRAERLSIHHIHGILGNEEMQRKAAKGLFFICRTIRKESTAVPGTARRSHRSFRMI